MAIDHLLVREASENLMVMSNGCICCSIAGDMVQALRDLYFKRANGEIPYFRRVIIETTGLADPAPIMHTLIEMPLVAARYSLSGILTTVDATHGDAELDQHFEAVKQVAVADRIVMTKTDLATAAQLTALHARLYNLNPGAAIFEAIAGEIDANNLLDTGLYRPGAKTPDVEKWLRSEAYQPIRGSHHNDLLKTRRTTPEAPRHDDRIHSFAVIYDRPLVWQNLIDSLEVLTSLRGDELLRVKGIVNVMGEAAPRAIHVVQHTIYPPARLPAWPDDDRRTRIVFIVRDLSAQFITDTLDGFINPAAVALDDNIHA